MSTIIAGNAHDERNDHQGWFLGHFMPPTDNLRSTTDLEVKWGVHQAGEVKPAWTMAIKATTLSILIHGKFHIHFPDRDILLSREGDYALWGPGVFHTWFAENDSVVITIRWPSTQDDVVVADEVSELALEHDKRNRATGRQ